MTFKRIITHWTGGGGRANSIDKQHYHKIVEHDGNIVDGNESPEDNIVTSDGDYAAHTRNLNTGSIGVSMAGMAGATEYPLDYGSAPINRVQFEAACRLLAELHLAYGIPVTRQTCLTHAEVEPTLGVKQRQKWDLTVLPFDASIRGAIPVGDYMRSRVKSYMGVGHDITESYPVIRQGIKGHFAQELQRLLFDVGYFPGKIDGHFGPRTKEALVNFQSANGLIPDGIAGPSTWAELMKAETRPERDVSMKDLKAAGSSTIKAADNGKKALTFGGGATMLIAAADGATGVADALTGVDGLLGTAQAMLFEYWPIIAVMAVGFIVWRNLDKIKASRLSDARTGKNMGR